MDLVLSRMVEDAIGEDIYRDRFERAIKEQFQYECAIAFRSPYNALIKAIEICDSPKGSRIAISALAPEWHRLAVADAGYEPQILDVDATSLHPTFDNIKATNPSIIILFDALGVIPPSSLLQELNIPVIEDVSQSIGDIENESVSDLYARFYVWGMEADSAIATGGGALLCARGKRDAQILRSLNDALPSELKMTDYNAALGVSQLKSFSILMERRKAIFDILKGQLSRTKHSALQLTGGIKTTYAFPMISAGGSKDIIDYAKKYGVQVVPAFPRSAAMLEENADQRYPSARGLALRCLLFPMHHKLANQQVDQIGKIIATLP